MTKIPLGKIAFTDKGTYSNTTTYGRFDFIVTEDSCYLSVKDGNVGHPVTDTAWWRCIANGKAATAAAKKALEESGRAAEEASNANSASVRAGSAASEAKKQADAALLAKNEAHSASDEAREIIMEGKAQIASMKTAEQSLMSQALLAPSRMVLNYSKVITLRNPVLQKIIAELYPSYVLQNVIFQQPPNGGDSVYVEPSGELSINKVGKTKIHVIPAQNTKIYQTVEIEVQAPALRLTGDGALRFNSDGSLRLT